MKAGNDPPFTVYDNETGEVYSTRRRVRQRDRVRMADLYGADWQVAYAPAWHEVRELRTETLRVFLFLWENMESGNHVRLRLRDISDELGVSRMSATRNIESLLAKEMIVLRRPYGWRIHPRFGLKGDPTGVVKKTKEGKLELIDQA
jgi:hypothetical protein